MIQRDLKHSHPFDEEDHEAAAFTMRGKVQNLREDIVERGRLEEARARREEERERRALEDGEDGESSSGSEDEGNVVVRPTRRAARASGLASRELDEPSDDYPNDSPDEDGAESDDEDAPRSNDRVKLVHINAHSLVSQINALQNVRTPLDPHPLADANPSSLLFSPAHSSSPLPETTSPPQRTTPSVFTPAPQPSSEALGFTSLARCIRAIRRRGSSSYAAGFMRPTSVRGG